MSLIGESKTKIVLHIDNVGETYGYAISKELNMSNASIYQHLSDLEEYDILLSKRDEERRIYELTDEGEKLVEILRSI